MSVLHRPCRAHHSAWPATSKPSVRASTAAAVPCKSSRPRAASTWCAAGRRSRPRPGQRPSRWRSRWGECSVVCVLPRNAIDSAVPRRRGPSQRTIEVGNPTPRNLSRGRLPTLQPGSCPQRLDVLLRRRAITRKPFPVLPAQHPKTPGNLAFLRKPQRTLQSEPFCCNLLTG